MAQRWLRDVSINVVRRLVPRGRLLLRDRLHLSFSIVVIFFAVYSIFMLTKILIQVKEGSSNTVSTGINHSTQKKHDDSFNSTSKAKGCPKLLFSSLHQPSVIMSGSCVKTMITAQPSETVHSLEKDTNDWLPGVGNTTAQDGVWQSVGGTRYKFFVFSAYYDFRKERIVRVIGTTTTSRSQRVWCRLWYHKNGISMHSISVSATIKVIRENWNLAYSACFVLCPLDRIASVPNSVSIVSELVMNPQNRLIIHQVKTRGKLPPPPRKMAACIKPLHYNYNKSFSVMEFIELNQLLGIEHFYFYNDTVSSSTSCVLNSYRTDGRVTVFPWQLDLVSQKEIRTEGMFAAFNDCLYRSMYSYSYVAFIDLDEFIMPQHNETLFQLIDSLGKQNNLSDVASFSIRNAFFYLQWSDDASLAGSDPFQSSLVTLRKTRRLVKLHQHSERSKYICRPEYVVEAGNHFVWEFLPDYSSLHVDSNMAILNHYRVCEFGGDDCVNSASVVDRTAFLYRDRLVKTVRERWNSFKSECNLPQVTTKPVALPTIHNAVSPLAS